MSEKSQAGTSEDVDTWTKQQLDEAVEEMMRLGVVTDLLVKARPVWALPFKILIGQIRDTSEETRFKWFISGEFPIDYIESAVASTPREAARHFALKWQLDAARYQDPASRKTLGLDPEQSWDRLAGQLADRAEALFALVNDDGLWQNISHAP